jgi:hypothetical protein
MMLVGVVAFNALKVIPVSDPRCIGVLLVGYVFQGEHHWFGPNIMHLTLL